MKVKNLYIEEDVLKDEKALRIQQKLRYENKKLKYNRFFFIRNSCSYKNFRTLFFYRWVAN